MKKYILALALLFVCHIGFAQDLNSLFDEFKKEPNADCISISPFMMAIGKDVHGQRQRCEACPKVQINKNFGFGSLLDKRKGTLQQKDKRTAN